MTGREGVEERPTDRLTHAGTLALKHMSKTHMMIKKKKKVDLF